MRRVISLAAVLAMAALAAPAGGHDGAFDTRSTINHCIQSASRDCFKGQVSADHPSCVVARRKVTVYGVMRRFETQVYRTRTGIDGRWKVILQGKAAPVRWYAIVRFREIDTAEHHHLCRGGRSRVINLYNPGG